MKKKNAYYIINSLIIITLLLIFAAISLKLELIELYHFKTELINKIGPLIILAACIYGIMLSHKIRKNRKIFLLMIPGLYLIFIVTNIEVMEEFYKLPIWLDIIEDQGVSIGLISIFSALYIWFKEREKDYKDTKDSLEQKNYLIKETHHRIKNNLSILSSLINLQTIKIKDDKYTKIFSSFNNRVKSMAFLHSMLYQTQDFSSININEYIRLIVRNLLESVSSKNIKVIYDIENVSFDSDTAIPLGLITTELATNAIKYGFDNIKKGILKIKLKRKGSEYIYSISNNGDPVPKDFDLHNTNTMGLLIVNSLTTQISGELSLDITKDTKFIIKFKDTNIAT